MRTFFSSCLHSPTRGGLPESIARLEGGAGLCSAPPLNRGADYPRAVTGGSQLGPARGGREGPAPPNPGESQLAAQTRRGRVGGNIRRPFLGERRRRPSARPFRRGAIPSWGAAGKEMEQSGAAAAWMRRSSAPLAAARLLERPPRQRAAVKTCPLKGAASRRGGSPLREG